MLKFEESIPILILTKILVQLDTITNCSKLLHKIKKISKSIVITITNIVSKEGSHWKVKVKVFEGGKNVYISFQVFKNFFRLPAKTPRNH